MVKRYYFFVAMLAIASWSFSATHVFWYKALERGYNLQANPGPNIPFGAIVYERMIMSAGLAQHSGNATDGFFCGSGLDDAQGRSGVVWSRDLCEMQGSCTSAKFRGEFRDGWSGNGFCNAGPITIWCGIMDFQGNIDIWGGLDLVSEAATWQDIYNPLCYTACEWAPCTMDAEDTIHYTAPAARPSETEPSVLDGQFAEIDITDQVNWILAHPGQWAIAFCVTPGMGSTGKINLYADEAVSGSQTATGSDNPWTKDGNTIHLVVEGDLMPVSIEKGLQTTSIIGLVNPNPFANSTNITFNLPQKSAIILTVHDIRGREVAVLAQGEFGAGVHAARFDGKDLASGIYVCRLTAGNRVYEKKIVKLR